MCGGVCMLRGLIRVTGGLAMRVMSGWPGGCCDLI